MTCRRRHAHNTLSLLQALKSVRPECRDKLLEHLNDSGCEILFETIKNVLRNDKVKAHSRAKLKKVLAPHKNALRYISKKGKPLTLKKKRLRQIGGNPLTSILTTAIPLLLQIISGL